MLRKLLIITFTAAVLACQAKPKEQALVAGVTNIMPDPQQQESMRVVVQMLKTYHFKKIEFTDSLAELVFDNYIKSLDPGKNYFTQADVKSFEPYRHTLLTDYDNGDLGAAFHIYNVYAKRQNSYLDYIRARVGLKYNFNENDDYVYDREKAPFQNNEQALKAFWDKKVKYDLLQLKLAGADEAKNKETLLKRYDNLRSQISKTNNQDVFQVIMDAFTGAIDPHSNYFNPSNAKRFNEEMSRSLEGIGASLQLDNEVIKIMEVIPGGPAFKSKRVSVGDRIVGVAQGNGEFIDLIGWRLDDAVAKIKGPKGTKVRLKIIPAGKELTSKPVVLEFIREKIILQDQSAKKHVKTITQDGKTLKFGVIEVPGFYLDFKAANEGDPNYKSTTRDVRLLLDTLKNIDKVDAVVLDLRGNGGGSLLEAIELTGLFIDKGPVVQVKTARGKLEVNEDRIAGTSWDGPLGVMVDRLSASASEIFAGAIQDYGRGIITGTQTFGKGTVQQSVDLNNLVNPSILQRLANLVAKDRIVITNDKQKDSNIQLGLFNITIAKFYRINGSSTQHKGVMPDISFPSVYPMDKIGEDTEPAALPWDEIMSTSYTKVADLSAMMPNLAEKHRKRMEQSLDYKYLLEQLAELKKRTAETKVTLNEAKLKEERDASEEKALKQRNEVRIARGLPALKKGETPKKDEGFDLVEDETFRIIIDYMQLAAK